jgi:hypothetical protein
VEGSERLQRFIIDYFFATIWTVDGNITLFCLLATRFITLVCPALLKTAKLRG